MDDLDMGATIRGLSPGQKICNRYTLEKILGRGGMGVVWRARDESLEQHVAIKMLPEVVAADPAAVRDLKRETRRSQQLSHPHILRIYDFIESDRVCGITMELVEGGTLTARRLEQPQEVFEVDALTDWVRQLGDALTYAHEKAHIVHRDLKPANIMLTHDGEVKVADFGISASVTDTVSRVSAQAGSSGTPVCMSPQQMMGEPPAVTDDIYALGATLYELLTGKPPFHSGNIILQVQNKVPPGIAARRAELGLTGLGVVPVAWEETIAACLAKEAKDRPQSVREVVKRLRSAEGGVRNGTVRSSLGSPAASTAAAPRAPGSEPLAPVPEATSTQPTALAPSSKRTPWGLIALGVVACALVAGGVGFYGWEQAQLKALMERVEAFTPAANREVMDHLDGEVQRFHHHDAVLADTDELWSQWGERRLAWLEERGRQMYAGAATADSALSGVASHEAVIALGALPDDVLVRVNGEAVQPDANGRLIVPPGKAVLSLSRSRFAPTGAELSLEAGKVVAFQPRWIGDWEKEKLLAEYVRLCRASLDRRMLSFDDYVWLLTHGVDAASRAGFGAGTIKALWETVMDEATAIADPEERAYAQFAAATVLFLVNEERAAQVLRAIAGHYAGEEPTEKSRFLRLFDPNQSVWGGHFAGSPWGLVPEVVRAQLPRYEAAAQQSRQPDKLMLIYRGYLDAGLVPEATAWRERCEREFGGDAGLRKRFEATSNGAVIADIKRDWYRAYYQQDISELERLARLQRQGHRDRSVQWIISEIYFHLGLDDTFIRWLAATGNIAHRVEQGLHATGAWDLVERAAAAMGNGPVTERLLAETALAQYATGFPNAPRRVREKLSGAGDQLALAQRAYLDALMGDWQSARETLMRLEQAGVLRAQYAHAAITYMSVAAGRMADAGLATRYAAALGPTFESLPEILVLQDRIDAALAWSQPGTFATVRSDWMNKLNWLMLKPHRLAELPWRHDLMAEQVALKLLWMNGRHPERRSMMVAVPATNH